MPYIGYKPRKFVAAVAPKHLCREWQKMVAETVIAVDYAIKKARESGEMTK